MAFDLRRSGVENPVRNHLAAVRRSFRDGPLEESAPRVAAAGPPLGEQVRAEGRGDVPADGVALVAVDAPLALLEVDGVGGQVPVDDGVAPEMEVQSLLPDRRGGHHEGPERRVERSGERLGPHLAAAFESLVAEGDGEAGAHTAGVELDAAAVLRRPGHVHPERGGAQLQGLFEVAGDVGGQGGAPLVGSQTQVPEPVTEHMGVLVQHRLEVPDDRVLKDVMPVTPAALFGLGLLRAPADDGAGDLGGVEEAPERASSPSGVYHGRLIVER